MPSAFAASHRHRPEVCTEVDTSVAATAKILDSRAISRVDIGFHAGIRVTGSMSFVAYQKY